MKVSKTTKAAQMLGSMTSEAKAAAARENGKKGGWPKGRKRGVKNENQSRLQQNVKNGAPGSKKPRKNKQPVTSRKRAAGVNAAHDSKGM